MPRATDILPITEFTRNYKKIIARIKKTGRPFVLTIDGKPAVVVQDAGAFERELAEADARYLGRKIDEAMNDPRPDIGIEEARAILDSRRLSRRKRAG